MKQLIRLSSILLLVALMVCCKGSKTAEGQTAEETVSDSLPIAKAELLRAWESVADYMDGVQPDSYLLHDIDSDGIKELFLANREVEDGDSRAVFTVVDGAFQCLCHTVYPTVGASLYHFYLGDGYLLMIHENHGEEQTAYILKNSAVERIAYSSRLIVGEEDGEPVYEFGEEGEPMLGPDFDHLEPDAAAQRYLNPQSLPEINTLPGWQRL